MNNSINYSSFVEMFLNSGDDFEPYGCVDIPRIADDAKARQNTSPRLARETFDASPWDD